MTLIWAACIYFAGADRLGGQFGTRGASRCLLPFVFAWANANLCEHKWIRFRMQASETQNVLCGNSFWLITFIIVLLLSAFPEMAEIVLDWFAFFFLPFLHLGWASHLKNVYSTCGTCKYDFKCNPYWGMERTKSQPAIDIPEMRHLTVHWVECRSVVSGL